MARKTTVAKFEEWVKDEANVELVLERIADGLTLQRASIAVKQPYTCLFPYFHSTPELQARYEAARRAFADRKMDENHEIADEVKAERDEVAKAKLRIEVNTASAKAFHRARWGETLKVEKEVRVGVDQALLGRADELLRLAGEKVVASVPEALPAEVEKS